MPDKHSDNSAPAVALGRQMTVEFYNCSAEILADVRKMEKVFLDAAEVSGAHVVNSNFHSFEPQGVSGVLVISESHFAVHAWPEHDYAAVDLFTCGDGVDFDLALHALAKGMKSENWIISSLVNRGILRETGVERLVPVVENQNGRALHLSWEKRFNESDARAISHCIDIYKCSNPEIFNGDFIHDLLKKTVESCIKNSNTGEAQFNYHHEKNHPDTAEFSYIFDNGNISGMSVKSSGNIYFTVFSDGFCDPRTIAEYLISEVNGTYYRMQIQIRQ